MPDRARTAFSRENPTAINAPAGLFGNPGETGRAPPPQPGKLRHALPPRSSARTFAFVTEGLYLVDTATSNMPKCRGRRDTGQSIVLGGLSNWSGENDADHGLRQTSRFVGRIAQ